MADTDFVSDYEAVTGKARVVTKVITAPTVETLAPVTVAEVK